VWTYLVHYPVRGKEDRRGGQERRERKPAGAHPFSSTCSLSQGWNKTQDEWIEEAGLLKWNEADFVAAATAAAEAAEEEEEGGGRPGSSTAPAPTLPPGSGPLPPPLPAAAASAIVCAGVEVEADGAAKRRKKKRKMDEDPAFGGGGGAGPGGRTLKGSGSGAAAAAKARPSLVVRFSPALAAALAADWERASNRRAPPASLPAAPSVDAILDAFAAGEAAAVAARRA